MELEVREERVWSQDESALFANPLFDNFAHYAPFSTDRTALSIAKVHRRGELIAVAPLVRLVRYQGTRLLEPSSRRWMEPLMGFFTRQTLGPMIACRADSASSKILGLSGTATRCGSRSQTSRGRRPAWTPTRKGRDEN
jgi:hypothetical protein